MAIVFNEFFSGIGPNLAKKIQPPKGINLPPMEVNDSTIFLHPTSRAEIVDIVLKMKDKAGGVDGITVSTLKATIYQISEPLEYIFNLIIETAKWPIPLKKAEVIPIYKSGDKSNATNYRPISLISNVAKILEKIIHHRLITFLEKHNLISSNQYGFRKNKSTTDALAHITQEIYNNMDNSTPMVATRPCKGLRHG